MKPVCLLPAAGASSRMRGSDKLMELVEGQPCLAVMAERAISAGFNVLISLPAPDHPRVAALKDLQVESFVVPDPSLGMSASLKHAARRVAPTGSAMMILPPDMPDIEINDLQKLRCISQDQPDHIIQASTDQGSAGHPVIFPNRILTEFEILTGDRGAAPLLKTHAARVTLVPLKGERAICDLDSPEAWQTWRASAFDL